MREGRAPQARASLVLACWTILLLFSQKICGRVSCSWTRRADRLPLTSVTESRRREGVAAYLLISWHSAGGVLGDVVRHSK